MRSSYHSQKPEAALQRACEFISVGKQKDALQALYDLIKDRRYKQWSQTYEQIMLKYVELCVNLRNSILAKDGLYQYKMITQQVAVKSLETVIEKFLFLAEQKTVEAQKHSIEKIEEIDDLDVADVPENLLLSFVSGAVAQDRMDRTVLSPWLRFLWDTYRNCLDLLRNNIYVEQLYHQIARLSFTFCIKYQRRNEFRKLCEMLRMHLSQIQKAQLSNVTHTIKLANIDSLSLMLETRLIQLDTAITMELWQEAYKSAEDLHNLMQLGKEKDKKIVKPSNYVNYYEKIALIFWKGGNTLFHAASLLQKFNIYRDMKKQFTDEEAMDQATRVLLATLSIPEGVENPPILTKHLDIEEQHIANMRILSALLRLPITPTREGILKEIARLNLPELALPAAFQLYKCIELGFNPLRIASVVQDHLKVIADLERHEYTQYTHSIKRTVAAKVLKQVSTVYESMSLSHLSKIIPFFDRLELEHFLVDICKQQSVKAHVDHLNNCIRFGPEDATLASELENETFANAEKSEVEKIQTHLENFYLRLHTAYMQIDSSMTSSLQEKLKRQIFIYSKQKDNDFERILIRRKKIENYKENTEQLKHEKLLQAQALVNKQEEQRRAEEFKKLQEENKENEKRRIIAEQEEIKKKVRADKLMKNKSLYDQLVKEMGEDALESIDPEQFIVEKRKRLEAERKEQHARLLQQEKKYDYSVRALHLEEMKVWKEISDERQEKAPVLHEQYEDRRIEKAIQDHEKSFVTYEFLIKAKDDAVMFMREVISSHAEDFKIQKQQWENEVEEKRNKSLFERKQSRKEDRKLEHKQKQEELLRQEEDKKRVMEQSKRQEQRVEEKERGKKEADQKRMQQQQPEPSRTVAEPKKGARYVPPSKRT